MRAPLGGKDRRGGLDVAHLVRAVIMSSEVARVGIEMLTWRVEDLAFHFAASLVGLAM